MEAKNRAVRISGLWPVSQKYGLPSGTSGKESACQCRRHKSRGLSPWVGKIPLRRKWQITLVLLPGKSHGQGSLVGYSSWGRIKSNMTEAI